MKVIYYFLILSICMASFVSCSDETNNIICTDCNDNEEDEKQHWFDSTDESGFIRAHTLRFYYVDENGKGLIDPYNIQTLPLNNGGNKEGIPEPPTDFIFSTEWYSSYNGNHEYIDYDKDEKLYYYYTSAYGNDKYDNYKFYVFYQGKPDEMRLTYKRIEEGVVGGKYWHKIISWKINGVHVYSDDDGHDKKVFIQKSNGETIISVGEK